MCLRCIRQGWLGNVKLCSGYIDDTIRKHSLHTVTHLHALISASCPLTYIFRFDGLLERRLQNVRGTSLAGVNLTPQREPSFSTLLSILFQTF